ncbi:SpoIIE family protein phosphatase [Candidatus Sumerlaeota bacterium]|nr:SpoIIE family protein phosphatase [Candidatus Sumerlaeota bacterium]
MPILPLAPPQFWSVTTLLVVIVAAWIIISLLRARIRRLESAIAIDTQERESVLLFLHRMGEMATNQSDLEATLEFITEFIIDETGASAGAIYLHDPQSEVPELRARVVQGLFPPLRPTTGYVLTKRKYLHDKVKAERIGLGEGVVGHVAKEGEGLLILDARAERRLPTEAHELVPLESMMLMPLKIREEVIGVFAVVNKRTHGQVFTDKDMSLLRTLADQAAVTVKTVQIFEELTQQQRVESELRIASDFQRLMLPTQMPSVEGFEIAAYCKPALEMGGDYYDIIRIDESHLGLVIADVSGKGVPGALIMSMVRSALRAEAPRRLSPADVLRTINQRVYEDTRSNVFITMTYAILDERAQTLHFARAGHEPVIACPTGDPNPVLYTPDGIALGLTDGEIFDVMEELVIDLGETDLVVLYTDGVVEAMDEEGREYGQERFLDLLHRQCDRGPEGLIQDLLSDIGDFTHGIPQHDDITLLALRRRREAHVIEAPLRQGQTG